MRSLITAAAVCLLGCDARMHEVPDQSPVEQTCPLGQDASVAAEVTVDALLREMVQLEHLTRLPDPEYSSHFVSSHDPSSDDAAPGEEAWYANRDFRTFPAGEETVLLEVEGPGALTRMWSATPAGTMRIYLDGADEPAVEAEMRALLRGDVEPMRAPFGSIAAGGHNLYFPVPFARGIRVTLSSDAEAFVYYHISYRRYADGTSVESYGRDALSTADCMLEAVAQALERPAGAPAAAGDLAEATLDTADAEATLELEAAVGGSVLSELRIEPETRDARVLRETMLVLSFDGEETATLPLGDFFANAVAAREVTSLPVLVDADGSLRSRWPMPFAQRARIALRATGERAQRFEVAATHRPAPFDERSLLFHAGWRAPETFASKPPSDWLLADLQGDGYYVGNVLNVLNPAPSWWGEGDEKIYIDDEPFPSHFGTGTEDYYGYAWCSNAEFSSPYIGQPLSSERQNFGPSTLYRFHVLDPLRFRSSLRFDMEVRHWGDPVDVTYDAASFWYSRPGSVARGMSSAREDYRQPASPDAPAELPEGAYTCGG